MIGKIKTYFTIGYAIWIYTLLLLIARIIEYSHSYIGVPESLANYTNYLAFLYTLICLILNNRANVWRKIIAALGILLVIFMLNFFLFPETNRELQQNIKVIILRCTPYLLLSISITDFSNVYSAMLKMAYPLFIPAVFLLYLAFNGQIDSDTSYYMTIAYEANLPILIFGIKGIEKKSPLIISIFMALSLVLLLLGCRGAFICIIVTSVIISIQKYGLKILTLPLITVALIVIFMDPILDFASTTLDKIGYDSRVIDKIKFGGMLDSSGREELRNLIMATAQHNQFPPYGLFGDRLLALRNGLGDIYIHNIFLEFVVDFGLIGAIAVSLLLTWLTFKAYRRAGYKARIVMIVITGCTLVKLFFSNSFLIDPLFYTYIGYISAVLTYTKHEKNTYRHIRYASSR